MYNGVGKQNGKAKNLIDYLQVQKKYYELFDNCCSYYNLMYYNCTLSVTFVGQNCSERCWDCNRHYVPGDTQIVEVVRMEMVGEVERC